MKKTVIALALASMMSPAVAQEGVPGGRFIESWDIDGDGVVSLEDITTRRGDVFLSFDADESGALDAEEYALFDQARDNDRQGNGGAEQGQGTRQASEGMTLAFNDVNGDGQVARQEFLARSGDWLTLMDRDGDGVITRNDFGRRQ